MSRRRSTKQDSLELLLDTICNTFGGVLFIAILVVLLLQQAGTSPASATPAASPISPLEMLSLTTRMEDVTDELIRLRQNRDSQNEVIQTFAPETIRQLLADRSAVTLKQESLQTDVDQLLAATATVVAHVDDLTAANETIRTRLDESKAKRDIAQTKLEEDRQSRVQEARLPVLHSEFGKSEIGLVLRYGRLYVWHTYGPGNIREGLNTADFVVVGEEGGRLVTHPNPTRGVVLDESETSKSAVRQILRQFDPKECYLVIVARPDSYGVFHQLRDQALKLGFEYRLMPAGVGTEIFDRGGKGGSVQ